MLKPSFLDSSERISLVKAKYNSILIRDPFRPSAENLQLALDFLNQQGQGRENVLIIGGFDNSDSKGKELLASIGKLIKASAFDNLIVLGVSGQEERNLFPAGANFIENAEVFLQRKDSYNFENKAILIKGLEDLEEKRFSSFLEERSHDVVMEIDLQKMIFNLNYYRAKLKKKTKLMAMVKAFSYGSGTFEIARYLEQYAVDYLGVTFADEGALLRQQGVDLPIMVLNVNPHSFQTIIDNNLEPEIYSIQLLKEYLDFIKELDKNDVPGIHLKIETGMNRLGFNRNELTELVEILNSEPLLKVAGVFSHLASADSHSEQEFTVRQIEKFTDARDYIKAETGADFMSHILNTSGISNYTSAQFDMVRLGIGLYGVSFEQNDQENLVPISTLKARISQIKEVQKGASVGYGRSYIAEKQMSIAIVNIGYADGLRRVLSNGVGSMFFRGKNLRIIGKVCMDMCMLDVTDIAIEMHDELEVFGTNKSVYALAKEMNTIPYEVLTSISQRVKRTYLL